MITTSTTTTLTWRTIHYIDNLSEDNSCILLQEKGNRKVRDELVHIEETSPDKRY